MTTVITTNVNIENEIKAIKQLEAEIKNLSEIKKDKENSIKSIMEQAGLETMDIWYNHSAFVSNKQRRD